MAKKIIRTGTTADPIGDSLKNAFVKVNDNFTELYNALGLATDITLNLGNFKFTGSTISLDDPEDSTLGITIDTLVKINSDLTVGGDIVPQTALGGDLGSSTLPWRSLYVSNNTIYIGGTAVGLDANGNLTTGGTVVGSTPAWANITGKPTIPTSFDRLVGGAHQLVLVVDGVEPYVTFPATSNNSQLAIEGSELSSLTGNLALTSNTDIDITSNSSGAGGGIKVWTFGTDGNLTIPGDIRSDSNINIEINLGDSTLRRWSFGEDGDLTLPSTSGFIDRLYTDNGGSRTKLEKKIESSPTAGTIAKLELDLDNGHIRLAIGNYTGGGDQWIDTSTWAFRGDTGSLTLPPAGKIINNNKEWIFGTTGTLTLPNGSVIKDTDGYAVAIGDAAGSSNQGSLAVAVGAGAGYTGQGTSAVAIGRDAGGTAQGINAVAIGDAAGGTAQGINAVAIGIQAGYANQGIDAVAIGIQAGEVNQAANSIIINATGTTLNQTVANTFTVAPIRNISATSGVLQYDASTKEVSYSLNVTAETFNTDQITIVGNRISTTVTNANLELECNGTGGVVINTVAEATTTSTARSVGYLGIPASAVTTTATLTIADAGEHIYLTSTGQTITIPANASVAYPIGTTLTFIAGPSATTTTIAITTDTMYLAGTGTTGSRTLAAHGMATAVKVAATTWYINGTGLT